MKIFFKKIRLLLAVAVMSFIALRVYGQGPSPTYNVNGYIQKPELPSGDLFGLDVDQYGNVYVVEGQNNALMRITPEKNLSFLNFPSGSYEFNTSGPLATSILTIPRGLYINPNTNNIYATGTFSNEISRVYGFNMENGTGGTTEVLNTFGMNMNHGMCMDAQGNMYVADTRNHRIMQLPAGGYPPQPWAGDALNKTSGNETGSAWGVARFNLPIDLCLTMEGNAVTLYVADYGNNMIRRIRSGQVTNVTSSLPIIRPRGIDVDCALNLYVSADNGVFRIQPNGNTQNIAPAGNILYPAGIKVNAAGNLIYVAEAMSDINWYTGSGTGTENPNPYAINKITLPTISITQSTSNFPNYNIYRDCPPAIIPPIITPFNACAGRTTEVKTFKLKGDFLSGNLTVTAPAGYQVSKSLGIGYGTTLTFTPSQLHMPNNVSEYIVYVRLSPSTPPGYYTGNITISSPNAATKSIAVTAICADIITEAVHVTTYSGSGREGFGILNQEEYLFPHGVATDQYGALIADTYGNRVRRPWDLIAGSGAKGRVDQSYDNAVFNNPRDLCRDASGKIYVADYESHAIRKITNYTVTTIAGGNTGSIDHATGTSAGFHNPSGICVNAAGTELYVADSKNARIRKVSLSGSYPVSTFAGSLSINPEGYENGIGTSAKFKNPTDVTIDANGNLYVTDNGNNVIRKIDPTGNVSTIAGPQVPGSPVPGYVDHTVGTNARFSNLTGITCDATYLYVSDGDRIRRILIAYPNTVSTYAGNGTYDYVDGPAATASFRYAFGLALDPSGNLFVADVKNHRIRKVARQNTAGTYTFESCPSIASKTQEFYISGNNLAENITVTAPAGFEIWDNLTQTYKNSITLPPTSGTSTLPRTSINVRLKPNSAGTYTGNITCTTSGISKNIAVSGTSGNPVISLVYTKDGRMPFIKVYDDLNRTSSNVPPDQIVSVKSAGNNTYTYTYDVPLYNLNNNKSMVFPNIETFPGGYINTVTAQGEGAGCSTTKTFVISHYPPGVNAEYKTPGTDAGAFVDAGFIEQSKNPIYSDNQNLYLSFKDNFGNPGYDISYKFTLTQASTVVVSNCNTFNNSPYVSDSYLYLLDQDLVTLLAQNDNVTSGGCSSPNLAHLKINLAPGTYHVVSEGKPGTSGILTTNISAFPLSDYPNSGVSMENGIPISSSTIGCGFNYSTTENLLRGFKDNNDGDYVEVFYKFTIAANQDLTIKSCNYSLEMALGLYDANKNGIDYAFNNGAPACANSHSSVIQRNATKGNRLAAGTYYLMVEHYYGGGFIVNLNLQTSPAPCRISADLDDQMLSESQEGLTIYPNPSTGKFNVEVFTNEFSEGTLVVTDLLGREVYQKVLDESGNNQIDLSTLSKGIYNVLIPGTKFNKRINLQ